MRKERHFAKKHCWGRRWRTTCHWWVVVFLLMESSRVLKSAPCRHISVYVHDSRSETFPADKLSSLTNTTCQLIYTNLKFLNSDLWRDTVTRNLATCRYLWGTYSVFGAPWWNGTVKDYAVWALSTENSPQGMFQCTISGVNVWVRRCISCRFLSCGSSCRAFRPPFIFFFFWSVSPPQLLGSTRTVQQHFNSYCPHQWAGTVGQIWQIWYISQSSSNQPPVSTQLFPTRRSDNPDIFGSLQGAIFAEFAS